MSSEIASLSDILTGTDSEQHVIKIKGKNGVDKIIKLWVRKDIAWSSAADIVTKCLLTNARTGEVTVDIVKYYSLIWDALVERVEPEIPKTHLIKVRADVWKQIASVFPSPDEAMRLINITRIEEENLG